MRTLFDVVYIYPDPQGDAYSRVEIQSLKEVKSRSIQCPIIYVYRNNALGCHWTASLLFDLKDLDDPALQMINGPIKMLETTNTLLCDIYEEISRDLILILQRD